MGNDIREIIPEIHVEQEAQNDRSEGVADDAPGDFQQQEDRHETEEEIQRFRNRGAADELVHVGKGVGDGGHAQEGQEQVQPQSPAAGVRPDRVNQKGQAENEGHVDHPEDIGFDREYGAVERPADKTDIERADRHGRFHDYKRIYA